MSETSKIRNEVLGYCVGKGLDLGCGGDKVTHDTWGFDLGQPYGNVGSDIIEMYGDARQLPFNNNVLDYIYSSHLLEDFPDIQQAVSEWLSVIKIRGYLILYLPNEVRYRHFCKTTGQEYNIHHSNPDMSLNYMRELFQHYPVTVVKEIDHHADYSFLIVVQKT